MEIARVLAAAMMTAALAAGAAGQDQSQPGGPGRDYPTDSRYIKRGNTSNWTLTVNVTVRAWSERDAQGMPVNDVWTFDTAAIVFPIIPGCASSVVDPGAVTGKVMFDDRDATDRFTVLRGYSAGTALGRWDLKEKSGREMRLEVTIPCTSWETVYDEAAASQVPWPKGDWPAAAKAALETKEWYIDFGPDETGSMKPFDTKPVDDLLRRWTGGKDPKSANPAVLAKVLAGEMIGHLQISGAGLNSNRLGQIEGIDLQGVPVTAERGRGNEFDAAALLAALYRRAGLPARVVVGVMGEDPDKKQLFNERRTRNDLRAWVEFALYDEAAKTLTWVPVDVARRRKVSSRTPAWDKPWKFFGSHDELDSVIPFAFQFHPPTTVRAYGSPGFWGWFVTPDPPGRAVQAIWFVATTTPVSGRDEEKKREEDRVRKR